MAECAAPPWPSQMRRGGGGQSERHNALARMRARRAGGGTGGRGASPAGRGAYADDFDADDDWERRDRGGERPRPPLPRGPAGASGVAPSARLTPRGGSASSTSSASKPWAAPWTPESPRHGTRSPGSLLDADDLDAPPPRIAMPEPPREAGRPSAAASAPAAAAEGRKDVAPQRRPDAAAAHAAHRPGSSSSSSSALHADAHSRRRCAAPEDTFDEPRGTPRARGPATARAARRSGAGGGGDDFADAAEDPVPLGAKGADFKTLQEMIAQGIKQAEADASKIDAPAPILADNDSELESRRAAVRRRREEENAARQREKDQARERRQREDAERRRRQAEELEREEQEILKAREAQKCAAAQCQREMAAASRIQALVRGRRSRAGFPIASPTVVAQLHGTPRCPPQQC
eukprot:TRINITY_DN29758_c0_g1_i1.p1 TRINITY_DN29758_c0_g1~~TRINITY_DN29758_c0_g1_i1.p1  ORF type:complete len:429 (+),score=95.19 TRINITY_DN29758_c0_g1_i1:68-1288(+)